MKNHLLMLLKMASKTVVYGVTIQCILYSMLWAADGNAQSENMSNVFVELNQNEFTVVQLLDEIESKTDFHFVYPNNVIRNVDKLHLDNSSQISVADVLYQVSKSTDLKFKQVNKTIYLAKKKKHIIDLQARTFYQDRTITGTVTSAEDEQPLPGVNVVIQGTATGTITDVDGKYKLSVPDGTTLEFSSVGFITERVEIGTRSVIDLSMAPDIQQLSEVVVIGYGEKSRKLLTESIGTVESKELSKVPVASADAALQGKVSGVHISNVDGTPGSPVAVRIRGVGTVGNSQPLFVIDGVPVGRNAGGTTNPLSTINPADIESMSVLKDASAAAVYGVRAANGVVLITTKKGKTGKPSINFDGYYGVQRTPELWDVMNVSQWTEISQEAYDAFNDQNNLAPTDDSYLTLHPDVAPGGDYTAQGLQSRGLPQPDWARNLVNENAPMQNYNLSVSGGSDDAHYHVSAGYFAQDAIVKKWDLERFTFRANSDYKVGERIRIGENFSLSHQKIVRGVNGGGDGFLLNNGATMPPFFQIYDLNNRIPGNRYGYDGNLDVAGLVVGNENGINDIVTNQDRTIRVLGGLYGEVELFKGLTFKSQASLDLSVTRNDSWNPGYTAQEMGLDRNTQQRGDSRGENSTIVFTNTLNYNRSFGEHTIDVLAGIEYQKIQNRSLSANADNFLSADPDFYILPKNGQDNIRIGGGASDQAYAGYLGRISYDYQKKYLITGSVRRDGTSRFSPVDNRRWGTFPSVSAAWRLSEEEFFQGVPLFSELKIRGSWGQLGNDQTTAFPHVFRVSPTPDYGLNGSNTMQAPSPVNFVNEQVVWETVEIADFGFDMGLFDDKITLLATYYNKRTKDFLISLPIPAVTGFTSTSKNVGLVINRGFEFELGYHNTLINGLQLDVTGNLTTVHNELAELAPGVNEFLESNGYRTGIGYPIGYMYGYKTDGLYQNSSEAAAALPDASTGQDPRAGDVRFVDTNGPAGEEAEEGQQFSGEPDGEITPEDRTYLGKTIPDFYYGLNFNLGWKGFDATVFFQGVSGVQLYNAFRQRAINSMLAGGGRNGTVDVMDRWTGEGSSTSMPRAISTDPNDNGRFSDRWVENAGYLRLKTLQIGYTLPENLLSSLGTINNVRIYVSATNLLTFTDYSGLDPEVMTYRSNGSQIGQDVSVGNPPEGGSGTDEGSIPIPKVFRVGVNLSF